MIFSILKACYKNAIKRIALGVVLLLSGCTTVPYRHTTPADLPRPARLAPGEAQVERGRPVAVVDALGNILGIPEKVILWNAQMRTHYVSPQTEASLTGYLAKNSLTNIKVRLNEYAPGGEFLRLVRNDRVGFGWRYTIGLVSWVLYTVLPQRVIGGDNYNPWTDTINIYSDHPAVALHEGGHAKDFAQRSWPGTYGFLYMLPFVALYHEARATSDALSYLHDEQQTGEKKDAYKVLYPAYGTYVGGGLSQYVWPSTWIYVAGVVPGHVIGRIRAARVEDP